MESWYQGRWDANMMADFYWTLKKEPGWDKNKSKDIYSQENKKREEKIKGATVIGAK